MEVTADGKPTENGQVKEDERWARDRVGWAPRFGEGDPKDNEGPTLLEHQTFLESKLEDVWFGGTRSQKRGPAYIS